MGYSLKKDVPPPLSDNEQWNARVHFAMAHQDGKCQIYGDDGELQCNNIGRHGRCIDFRREPFQDLLDIVQATRMKEGGAYGTVELSPSEIVAVISAAAAQK